MNTPLKDTYRVQSSGDASVRAVAPAINGNQEALRELQLIVAELSAEVIRLCGVAEPTGEGKA